MLRKTAIVIAFAISFGALSCWPHGARAEDQEAEAPRDGGNPLAELISGYDFSPIDVRALQDDDFDNPGFDWVSRGEALWSEKDGTVGTSCAACHGKPADGMRGRTAEYPKFY